MTFWAIVPVKPIRRGKSRLAKALTDEQRAELNKNLLVHTVDILKTLPELEQILVVSRDPEALAGLHHRLRHRSGSAVHRGVVARQCRRLSRARAVGLESGLRRRFDDARHAHAPRGRVKPCLSID